MPPTSARCSLASLLPRQIGKAIAPIVGAVLIVIVVLHGELWAFQQAPLLFTDTALAASASAGCLPDDSADAGALPVAILH